MSEQESQPSRGQEDAERRLRERELDIRERELAVKEADAGSRKATPADARWRSPLVVAVLAAAAAAAGNAAVTFIEGRQTRALEADRAEQSRILEMIKTGDPDTAATNLQFLLDAGLLRSGATADRLAEYLAGREPGTGPALASGGPALPGIVGIDDAGPVDAFPASHPVRRLAPAVGRLRIETDTGETACTAFLVQPDVIATADFCADMAAAAEFDLFAAGGDTPAATLAVDLEDRRDVTRPGATDGHVLLGLRTAADARFAPLALSSQAPVVGMPLAAVYFRGDGVQLAIWGADDCRVTSVDAASFHHLCDTGVGTSGSPLIDLSGGTAAGLHTRRSAEGGVALRLDP